jgi:SPP1 family predicted phage head-tail adaptor
MELPYNIVFSVQESTATADGLGGQTETWSAVSGLGEVNGRRRLLSGNEIIANEKRGYNSTHRFYCDYTSSITEGQRIVYGGEYYSIKFVDNPHNENEFLQIDVLKTK